MLGDGRGEWRETRDRIENERRRNVCQKKPNLPCYSRGAEALSTMPGNRTISVSQLVGIGLLTSISAHEQRANRLEQEAPLSALPD